MPSPTALITRSLGLLGVLEATEVPSAADLALGLDELNDLIDAWGLERQTIHEIRRSVNDLTANVTTYTIGPGATWNMVRPIWISAIGVIIDRAQSPVCEIAIGPAMTLDAYQSLIDKTATSSFPTALYYDASFDATGRARAMVYPTPNTSAPQIVLYLPTPMTEFTSATTDYLLPRGWRRALTRNLAVTLAPHYQTQASPKVEQEARESLAAIKRANHRLTDAGLDPALSGPGATWNIYAGE